MTHVRWSLLLESYQFEIRYKKETTNVLADAISRRTYGLPQPIREDNEFLNDHHFIATISQNIATDTEREDIFFEYNEVTEQDYNDKNQQSILTITNISETKKGMWRSKRIN